MRIRQIALLVVQTGIVCGAFYVGFAEKSSDRPIVFLLTGLLFAWIATVAPILFFDRIMVWLRRARSWWRNEPIFSPDPARTLEPPGGLPGRLLFISLQVVAAMLVIAPAVDLIRFGTISIAGAAMTFICAAFLALSTVARSAWDWLIAWPMRRSAVPQDQDRTALNLTILPPQKQPSPGPMTRE